MAITTWGAGDYPMMAERLQPVAALAIDRAAVDASDRVVDVACGTGNAALLADARGAATIGVDFEPSLLAVARAHESNVDWREGDVTALPVDDAWASVVVSVFGVMYAPDHEAAARELARVAQPRARVVLASWVPGSLMPEMGRVLAEFLPPPPPGSGPPSAWGDHEALAALLGDAGLRVVSHSRESVTMSFADADHATSFLIRTAGNVIAERERLSIEGRWDDLRTKLRSFVVAHAQPDLTFEYLLAHAVPA